MQDAQGRPAKYGGRVYSLGPQGVDEYSPIYTPETFQTTGDTYAPGPLGLAVWAVGFAALLLADLLTPRIKTFSGLCFL